MGEWEEHRERTGESSQLQLFGGRSLGCVALGGVGLGGGGVGGRGLLFAVFGHEDVVKAVLLVELVEIHVALDAADTSRGGVLPQGVTDGGGAAVVGYEYMVGAVALASEMFVVDLLAGVYHGLGAVFLFHEFEQFVDTRHVEPPAVVPFDVEDGYEVLLLLDYHRLEIGELAVGRGLAAVDVVTAHQDAGLAGGVDVGLVVGVLDGGAFGGTDVYELDFLALGDFAPVDGALVFRHVNALCLQGGHEAYCKHKDCESEDEPTWIFHRPRS